MRPARLRPADLLRVGLAGLRTRRTRVVLSALGISLGIAAMVGVVGISSSSQGDLDRRLAALGTNLLTVSPGTTLRGETASLPDSAMPMIGRIGPVTQVAATGTVDDAKAYRNDKIPSAQSGGLSVRAASLGLLDAVGATVVDGAWLNAATERYPTVVLGAKAAKRLGIGSAAGAPRVLLGGRWFTVVGILAEVPLAPDLDSAALIGWPVAESELGFDGQPTTVYTRSRDEDVAAVRAVLAATANPSAPSEVQVSRPSDALAARQASAKAFTGLMLGLGAVALLVGGVGIANTMVISVLERRSEIGLRRALGATKGQVRSQFLVEALLLSALGGAAGVVLGVGVTAGHAATQGWQPVVPAWASAGALGATLVIGVLAGVFPAVRAARLAPTDALAA